MGAVTKALPHLARPCDRVAKEVLAFISIMLFNANEPVQVSVCLSVCLFVCLPVCLSFFVVGIFAHYEQQ